MCLAIAPCESNAIVLGYARSLIYLFYSFIAQLEIKCSCAEDKQDIYLNMINLIYIYIKKYYNDKYNYHYRELK